MGYSICYEAIANILSLPIIYRKLSNSPLLCLVVDGDTWASTDVCLVISPGDIDVAMEVSEAESETMSYTKCDNPSQQ